MFRIGDFSQLAQVSIRTLRHYNDLGLLEPAHVDEMTDYRYYNVEQLFKLHRIVALKDLGFSLKEIGVLVEDSVTLNDLRSMLERKQAEVNAKLKAEQERLMLLEARLKQIEDENETAQYDITLKKIGTFSIFSKRQTVPHLMQMSTYCPRLFTELFQIIDQQNLNVVGHPFILYHTDGFSLEKVDVEACVSLDDGGFKKLRPPDKSFSVRQLQGSKQMASLVHHGYFHDLEKATKALLLWGGHNGYHSAGAAREIHLSGPVTVTGKDEPVVVEMQVPVASH